MLETRHGAPEGPSWACVRLTDPHKIPIDSNGNLATKTEGADTWAYEWNAENLLTKVDKNGSEVARFAYDPFGRRVERTANGIGARYTYDVHNLLVEDRGGLVQRYVQGPGIDLPLAGDDGSTFSFFHVDALGSVSAVTRGTGTLISTRTYDAWGVLAAGGDAGYSFTGREWDPETGLYYYRARYYDATIGRFISEDPVDYKDGLSRFAYVLGNPPNLIDPTGLYGVGPGYGVMPIPFWPPPTGNCAGNCPDSVKDAARNLCMNATKISDVRVRQCVQWKCRAGLPITCGGPECNYTTPIVYGLTAPNAQSIMVCANHMKPGGCFERTIAHEMFHTCLPWGPQLPGHNPNDQFTRQVRDAVSCPFP